MTTRITLDDFTPLLGQTFSADSANTPAATLELIEATALPAQPGSPRAAPFSLVFRASRDHGLTQGLVRLAHADIETLAVFLVPIGEDADGKVFQAVFN